MAILDETIIWEKGRLVIFDNAYHHEVWNETDEMRVILMFDVVRPMRGPMELSEPCDHLAPRMVALCEGGQKES